MIDFHPLANIFPLVEGQDFADLVKDIRTHGLREPIVLLEGKILDGRNRYRACVAAGLLPGSLNTLTVPQLKYFKHHVPAGQATPSQDQLLDFVWSKNFHRRQLDKSQRAMVMADYETFRHGGARRAMVQDANLQLENTEPAPAGPTRAELAERGHVSERLLASAAVVRDHAIPELKEAVRQGGLAVTSIEEIALQPAEQQKAIYDALPRDDAGKLTPEAKKALAPIIKEVRAEKQAEKKEKRTRREADLADKILSLPEEKAGLILSDFEWHFKVRSAETGMDRHAANHYVTASDAHTPEAIVERQRERMSVAADDCIHLMWVPASFSAIGHKVMELQGFTYVSQFVWIKDRIGTGFWVRDKHELLFIGVKGKVPAPAMGDQFESAITAAKGAHSEKPDFQYEIAEHYFPNLPKIELNARRVRPGWMRWGNEAPPPAEPDIIPPTEPQEPEGEGSLDIPAFLGRQSA